MRAIHRPRVTLLVTGTNCGSAADCQVQTSHSAHVAFCQHDGPLLGAGHGDDGSVRRGVRARFTRGGLEL